jgi:hypothetical protein
VQKCDKSFVATFDYSKLNAAFCKLAKPVQRALINNRIYSLADLAKWRLEDLTELHGIGPAAVPLLKSTLRSNRLAFKE